MATRSPEDMKTAGAMKPGYERVLTDDALQFVADIARKFDGTRRELLKTRADRQNAWDAGGLPDFLPDTAEIRQSDWKVAGIPDDLQKRWVELTGPTERKMVINALNSGADVFMTDFEDALAPTWENIVEGQIALLDYWQDELTFTDPKSGKSYEVGSDPAMLLVRPRGWHLPEAHILLDGEPVAGAFVDFGLYFFHNAKRIIDKGSAPYFYLPKLESHQEAKLWNDVFVFAQEAFGIPVGTIKATVLIETLPAAFEMDEILYVMRDHIVGLNVGRWDYIFSFIKVLRNKPEYTLPDRQQVVMGKAFLGAYARLLVQTCHKRGAFAMGGMAAQIPNRREPEVNEKAMAAVQKDKEREVREGCDGSWVAHPDLVPVARQVFERLMKGDNQVDVIPDTTPVSQTDLLQIHEGTRTEEGLRTNIRVGVQYIEAWLRGNGAVPLYNLMEDAATAEISRTQIWQWQKHGATLEDGREVTVELVDGLLADEMAKLRNALGADVYDKGRFPEAIEIFKSLSEAPELAPFLTLPAYRLLSE
ncbi:MAG: malate synthase A [Hyphomicrobiaceae bacterium]|nr:malate synthase A [Hyphomicrobiaceae bacterium]